MSDPTAVAAEPERVTFSNSIQLSGWQWIGIALFSIAFVVAAPRLWQLGEDFPIEKDYRIPHTLSQDYWLFERYAGVAVEKCDVVILGDSVVWGEYVLRDETLSHYLNKQAGGEGFANLGVGAMHPLALAGLIENYAGSVANMKVVLQCNPLWVSSPIADLQDARKQAEFNHPRLVPQFVPHIPAYTCPWMPDDPDKKKQISERLGILVEQRFAFNKWTNHLQQAYYGSNIPACTLEHPYENPVEPLTRRLPPAENRRRYPQQPWYKNRQPQDYPWVDMESSLQWRAFQRAVEILQRRGNHVFVVVGPLNEHMMTAASRQRYQSVKATIASWLKEKQVPHVVATLLPSEQYGDASHPLAVGYETLAGQLWDDAEFRGAFTAR